MADPKILLKNACINLLRNICICVGQTSPTLNNISAITTLPRLLRDVLKQSHVTETKQKAVDIPNKIHEEWCTLSLVRSIASTESICLSLSTLPWVELLLEIIAQNPAYGCNVTLYKQVISYNSTCIKLAV